MPIQNRLDGFKVRDHQSFSSIGRVGIMQLNSRNFGIVKIHLPDLGEGTKEATIKEWYVEPGSVVSEVSHKRNPNLISYLL